MKTGVFKRVGYFVTAFALAASGLIFVPGTDASAIKEGAVIDDSGDVIKVDMYLDVNAGVYTSVGDVGVAEPSDVDRVEKVLDGSGIASYDLNEDNECLIGGNEQGRVGQGMITCKYWQNEAVVLTVEATVHTYVDPNWDTSGIAMLEGSTLRLADVAGRYFDDPTKIKVWTDADEVECEEGEEYCGVAFELTGTTVADAVVKANDIATSATIYFYGPYSGEGEEISQLDVSVFKKPELKDLNLIAYGEDADKSVEFGIEDEGNLPAYTIASSDENIVSFAEAAEQEDEMHPTYTLTAEGVGEATITVTYDTYDNPTQTFKVTVDETAASGVYTELEATSIDASTLSNLTINDFEATKRASSDVILGYYDVELLVKNATTDATIDHITEAGSARKVVLAYPSDLPELADGYTRVYYVIRDHNGTKEILPAYDNGDGENFYFYSDEFSTFALAYYDVETVVETVTSDGATLASATTNPNTLDDGMNYMMMAGVAAVVMVGAIVYLMKQEV